MPLKSRKQLKAKKAVKKDNPKTANALRLRGFKTPMLVQGSAEIRNGYKDVYWVVSVKEDDRVCRFTGPARDTKYEATIAYNEVVTILTER